MTSYLFSVSAQGWTGMSFDGTDGSPSAGCLSGSAVNSVSAQITGLSIPTVVGNDISCRCKGSNIYTGGSMIGGLRFLATGDVELGRIALDVISGDPWLATADTIHTSGTVVKITFVLEGPGGGETNNAWLDSVYLNEAPTGYGVSSGGIPGAVLI